MHAENGKTTETLNMNMLLEALPKESTTDPTGRRLAQLINRIATRRVPVNSFSRIWTLGSLQARVTAGYFAYWLRSRFADANKRQRLKSEAHLAAALKLFGTMGAYYRLHWFFADPHPGNFIFMPDGRLGLIDFGCTRVMTDDEWLLVRELEEAHRGGDAEYLDRVIARASLYDSTEAMGTEQLAAVRRGVLWNMEPWLKEGLFDFGDRGFFMRGIENLMELTRKRYTRGSPLYLWSTRFVLGGRAACYRMRGRCEFRKIFMQEAATRNDPTTAP